MVNRGKLTTIVSDTALIAGSIYTAGTITSDILIQGIILFGGLGLAIADVYFPDIVNKIETALENQDNIEALE